MLKSDEVITYDIAVIDPGYSNFKIRKLNLAKRFTLGIIQPSVISEVPEWQYKNLNGIAHSAAINFKGRYYLVGNLALSYGLGIPPFSQGWLEELACPLFTLSFCRDVKELYILLSPADWDLKEKIEKNLNEAGFNNIKFAPQGVGIWMDVGSPKNAIVIDIGFNTVDVFIVIDGKPIRELCFALRECGLVSFLEKLTKDDPFRLARRLEEGDKDLTERAKEYYYGWLIRQLEVRPEWRRKPAKYVLVFGGGGARFLPDEVKKMARIPKDPEQANVRGFAQFLLSKLSPNQHQHINQHTDNNITKENSKEDITNNEKTCTSCGG